MRTLFALLLGVLATRPLFAELTVSANDVPSQSCMNLVGEVMAQVHPRMKRAAIELVSIDELLSGETSGLSSALEELKVDPAVRAKVIEGFQRVHAHRELYPLLDQIYRESVARQLPAAPLCLIAGDCQDHKFVWVPLVPTYTSSAGPFTGEGAKDPAKDERVKRFIGDLKRLRPTGTPEGLIALNAEEIVGKTGDPEEVGYDFAAKIIHEVAHRTTNRMLAAWIEKNRGRTVPDAVFQKYVRLIDGLAVIEHGFVMFLGESISERAYCEARWAMLHENPPTPDVLEREFVITMTLPNYGQHFVHLEAGGRYGQDTVRFLKAGLLLGDEHYRLTQQNFLSTGMHLEFFLRTSILARP